MFDLWKHSDDARCRVPHEGMGTDIFLLVDPCLMAIHFPVIPCTRIIIPVVVVFVHIDVGTLAYPVRRFCRFEDLTFASG